MSEEQAVYRTKARGDIIIGIDPDINKSGLAVLDAKLKSLSIMDFEFPLLLDYLKEANNLCKEAGVPLVVIVEAGWLNKSNWHLHPKHTRQVAAEIGNRTGQNFAVGMKIIEMCRHWDIKVKMQKPLAKHWKGPDKKITHKELKYLVEPIVGPIKATNPEKRDAVLLAWHYAGFPMRMKA